MRKNGTWVADDNPCDSLCDGLLTERFSVTLTEKIFPLLPTFELPKELEGRSPYSPLPVPACRRSGRRGKRVHDASGRAFPRGDSCRRRELRRANGPSRARAARPLLPLFAVTHALCMARERGMAGGVCGLHLHRIEPRQAARCGAFLAGLGRGLARFVVGLRPAAGSAAGFAFRGRLERNSGAACLAKTDRDGLASRPRSVFSLTHVFYFFMNKFSGCGGGRFSFAQVFPGFLDDGILRHGIVSWGGVTRSLVSMQGDACGMSLECGALFSWPDDARSPAQGRVQTGRCPLRT